MEKLGEREDMRENPFIDIYRSCNNGKTNKEKNECRRHMEEPLLMDVELTNSCNLQCYMCPTGTGSMVRKKGFMTEEVMDRIIANLKGSSIGGIRFILWGEPTLHPHFLEFAGKVKKIGKLVHFNTNGILLTEHMMRALVDMEIDSVKFSFQGVDRESYEEMRFGSEWDQIIGNIKKLNVIRGGMEKPYIQISTTVTTESEDRIKKFVDEMTPLCEYINVGQTILNHLDLDKMNLPEDRKEAFISLKNRQSLVERHLDICPEVYNKLSILYNGDVTMCCNDFDGQDMVLGNILHQSIQELWKSPKAEAICKMLEDRNNYDEIGICSICYEYITLKS